MPCWVSAITSACQPYCSTPLYRSNYSIFRSRYSRFRRASWQPMTEDRGSIIESCTQGPRPSLLWDASGLLLFGYLTCRMYVVVTESASPRCHVLFCSVLVVTILILYALSIIHVSYHAVFGSLLLSVPSLVTRYQNAANLNECKVDDKNRGRRQRVQGMCWREQGQGTQRWPKNRQVWLTA